MNDIDLIPDGFHPAMPEWRYRKDPAVAISDLKEMRLTPAHYYSKKYGGFKAYRSPAQEVGTPIHYAILEPEEFQKRYKLLPDDAPKKPTSVQRSAKKPSDETVAAIQWWDQWEKDNAGCEIISSELMAQVNGAMESVSMHHDARAIIDASAKEMTMVRTVTVNDRKIRIKGRADLICPAMGIIADVKTVGRGEANEYDFGWSIRKWAYHMQAAWYLDLNEGLLSDDPFGPINQISDWVFIVVEKEPPFDVVTLTLDRDAIEAGRSGNQHYLRILSSCMKTDSWPGRSQNTRGKVSLPKKWGDA